MARSHTGQSRGHGPLMKAGVCVGAGHARDSSSGPALSP